MTAPDRDWIAAALCKPGRVPGLDPDAFFPHGNTDTSAATSACRRCPSTDQCLSYAMGDLTLEGIWGGLSHSERKRLAKQRAKPRTRVLEVAGG